MCKLVESHECGYITQHTCTNPPIAPQEQHTCTYNVPLSEHSKGTRIHCDRCREDVAQIEAQEEANKKSNMWNGILERLKGKPQSHEDFMVNGPRRLGFKTFPCDECRGKAKALKKEWEAKQKAKAKTQANQ
ncbi:hypothetical protein G7Y89_g8354 [Cudoniella acicularis]|uniref:Uncharacterized protein n=1 Tax=Cudoniella acicularis TaxID=354080 RepID=A0A8H4W2Y2_9HELO|nr:hypothetical protein G7Y89_g8354 [Cudoniella acicularis]